MAISCRCPHCGHAYTLRDELGGKKGKCKSCGKLFPIPLVDILPEELSPSGQPIYRHEAKMVDSEHPPAVTPWLEQIERHVEKHIGPIGQVFHEIVSDEVHLDLLIIPPTGREADDDHPLGMDHFTIVTAGMSARPMAVPPQYADAPRYAELMIALPADWPGLNPDGTFDQEVMSDERYWWPFKWLKMMARLPHEYETYLGVGHTVPNGEEADPFAGDTRLGCMLILPPLLTPAAAELPIDDEVTIQFYTLVPIYPEEMALKLSEGLEALVERLDNAEVTELIRADRENTCL